MKFIFTLVVVASLQLSFAQSTSAQVFELADGESALTYMSEGQNGQTVYATPVYITRNENGEVVNVTAVPDVEITIGGVDLAVGFVGGMHFGAPTLASVSAGLLVGIADTGTPSTIIGSLIELEAGVGGGSASIGLGAYIGGVLGGTIKGTVLRTWGNPVGVFGQDAEPGNTYVGANVTLGFLLKGTFGAMKRVSGTTGSDWIWVLNTGFAVGGPF